MKCKKIYTIDHDAEADTCRKNRFEEPGWSGSDTGTTQVVFPRLGVVGVTIKEK